jgi:cephalosporin hydroxylase
MDSSDVKILANAHATVMIDPVELQVLADCIQKVARNSKVACIEIGSWHGKTAVFAHKVLHDIDLIWLAVDPMSLYGEPVETNNPTGSEQELLANIQSNHAVDRILPLISGSNAAAKVLRSDWDFIFIDGYHSFEQTLNDLENYWPLLRLGGILMLDDYVDAYPGVKQAWDEFQHSKSQNIRVLKKEWFIVAEKI